jgi:hypothetical protein
LLEELGLMACQGRLRSWLAPAGFNLQSDKGVDPKSADAINIENPNLVERTRQIEDVLLRKGFGIYR